VNQIPRMGLAHVLFGTEPSRAGIREPTDRSTPSRAGSRHGSTIGGEFTNVFRCCPEIISPPSTPRTGRATTWNPNADFPVRALAVRARDRLRGWRFPECTAASPELFGSPVHLQTTWRALGDAHADGNVRALVTRRYHDLRRRHLRERRRKASPTFSPPSLSSNGVATDFSADGNNTVTGSCPEWLAPLCGGQFSDTRRRRPYLAIVDATTGAKAPAQQPFPNGPVTSLATAGGTVYLWLLLTLK
jgi:hypothetical protein